MNKEKQIEELTNVLIFTARCGTYREVAEHLHNAGYRKASEVVREIIDIIERRMSINEERYKGVSNEVWQTIYKAREHAYKDLKEIIEQKYTESENVNK